MLNRILQTRKEARAWRVLEESQDLSLMTKGIQILSMKIGQEMLALHHFPLFKLTKIKYNKMIKEANLDLQVDFLRSKIIRRAHLK